MLIVSVHQLANTKMSADSFFAPKYKKMSKTYLPNLFAQDQKFGILMKKGFIGHPQVVYLASVVCAFWSTY